MTNEGNIHSPEAYAQSKMLDHSGWYGKLPRGSRPSDIDFVAVKMVFDNNGSMLWGELSRSASEWGQLDYGQKWLYESAIKFSPHCAVLCFHNAPLDRKIDTYRDVISFQPMVWDYDFVAGRVYDGVENWHKFVNGWFKNSLRVRRFITAEHFERVLK